MSITFITNFTFEKYPRIKFFLKQHDLNLINNCSYIYLIFRQKRVEKHNYSRNMNDEKRIMDSSKNQYRKNMDKKNPRKQT